MFQSKVSKKLFILCFIIYIIFHWYFIQILDPTYRHESARQYIYIYTRELALKISPMKFLAFQDISHGDNYLFDLYIIPTTSLDSRKRLIKYRIHRTSTETRHKPDTCLEIHRKRYRLRA